MIDNNTRPELTPNPVVSKFIESAPDHLLLEIFLRLPNGRCVIQLATVCKRWRCLIINPRIEKFASDFLQYHRRKQSQDSSYSPANTTAILFHYSKQTDEPSYLILHSEPRLKLFSRSCTVRASCGDLLLLSRGLKHYFIYNPHTRQRITLPDLSLISYIELRFIDRTLKGFRGYGLVVRDPNEKAMTSYRVVLIEDSYFAIDNCLCHCLIFNSETGLWSRQTFRVRYIVPCCINIREIILFHTNALEVALTRDGVLHWLVYNPCADKNNRDEYYAVVFALDPFRLECSLVPIPDVRFRRVFAWDKLRLGVVRGRLWLSQMLKINDETGFVLRAWELGSAVDSTWWLVHDVELWKSGDCSVLSVLAFDHNDGNVVYLVRDGQVYRYEIGVAKYDKVCRFPYYSNGSENQMMNKLIADSLRVVTLVHSLWPMRLRIECK